MIPPECRVWPDDGPQQILERAWRLATNAHGDQTDKAGQPYVKAHVGDVVRRINGLDPLTLAVAWLHDVVEDTDVTADDLRDANYPTAVIDAVDAISRRMREHPDDYYARVRTNPRALVVKLADIASNTDPERLALLDEATRDRLTAKYAHALAVLT